MVPYPSTDTAFGIWSLNEIRNARRGDNWPSVAITAVVTSSSISVDEGNTVTFSISTEYADDGTVLYYNISGTGVTTNDFTDSTLSDSFVVNNNSASISKTLTEDNTTEGLEVLTFTVRSGSISGPILSSIDVDVNDTSTAVQPLIPLFDTWHNLSTNATSTLASGALYQSDMTGYVGPYVRDSVLIVDNENTTIDLNGSQLNYLNCEAGGGSLYTLFGWSTTNADNFKLKNGYIKITGTAVFVFSTIARELGYGSATGSFEDIVLDVTGANLGQVGYANSGDVTFTNVKIIYDQLSDIEGSRGVVYTNRGTWSGYETIQKDTTEGQNLLASFPY